MPATSWPATMSRLRHRATTSARLRPVPTSCPCPDPMPPGYLSAAAGRCCSADVEATVALDVGGDLGLRGGEGRRVQGRLVGSGDLGEVVVDLLEGGQQLGRRV